VEQLGGLWSRLTAEQPSPPLWTVILALVAALAVVLVPVLWRIARHAVTIVHEAGHGFAATLSGRRLAGIRLHSDTSGVTVSVGRPTGPGMVFTLLAGYPAPAWAGLGCAALVGAGRPAAALWALLGLLVLVLLQIRNWFGLLPVVLAGAALFAVTWWAPPGWHAPIAVAVAGFLLLGALRASLELQGARRREGRTGRAGTDADQLARATRVPGIVWVAGFVLVAAACVVGGGLLLLPLG
jgi:hypothetical protein